MPAAVVTCEQSRQWGADLVATAARIRDELQNLAAECAAAQAADAAKGDFLAHISHELRSPLHGILSYSRFGLSEAETAERSELANYFRTIHQCSESLVALVDNLLDLSKLEAGRMELHLAPVDMGALVAQVVDEFRSLCSERGIAIAFAPPREPLACVCDHARIAQVVRNLLANAVKFSPEGTSIDVSLTARLGLVSLTVADQGPGIAADELETIFEKFTQSRSRRPAASGTGLGLAICRQITASHHGRIWAENQLAGGAVFCVELPTEPADCVHEKSIPAASAI